MLALKESPAKTSSLIIGLVFMFLSLGFISSYPEEDSLIPSHWKGCAVFEEKGCIKCHAIYGKGGKGGPDIGEQRFYGTYLDLAALMWNHLPKMIERMRETGDQFSHLNVNEMEQLVTCLSVIRYMGEPGNAQVGIRLLKSKGCVRCHKFGVSGRDIGPDICAGEEYIEPLRVVESMWNHSPKMYEVFKEYAIRRPEFKGNELDDLAAGMRSYMRPAKVPTSTFDLGDQANGKKISAEKGCMNCHAVRGIGGKLGPDFDEVDFSCSVTEIAGKMWNHAPKMWDIMKGNDIPFPIFERGDMVDIIAYFYELMLEDEPGDAQKGHNVAVKQKCISCHMVRGEGAGSAVDFASLDQVQSPLEMIACMWNHAPIMAKEQLEKKLKWPKLEAGDMADLYAYLRSISLEAEN
jgi:cytochrome c551/c552